jgi:WD40 repeat protein
VAVATDRITVYSALDGKRGRTYPRQLTGEVIDVAFSPDGQWLGLILSQQVAVQVLDLRNGLTQTTPLASDPKAATPGLSGTFTGPVWSTLVFAPDSKRLYTIVDWGGPLRLTAFDVSANGLLQTATAVNGQAGKSFPSCGGPGLAARVLPDGKSLIVFCHMDGDVWLIDLPTLTAIADRATGQSNPFELSPIFTPDGQLVYLRGGTKISAFDVASRTVVGPVSPPRKLDDAGPFSWLFPRASAGYIASTVPVSPDGTKLYLSGGDGITVLRIPDLKPIAKLAPGLNLGEVWISGDGKTVYATDSGHGLYVMPESGGNPIVVTLPGQTGGYFVASEHG